MLTVGRLEKEKNPLLLVDIAVRLRASKGDWRPVICGDGPMEAELRAHIAERGMDDHVELRGYVGLRNGLLDLYRSAHVLLHVSWSEGLPRCCSRRRCRCRLLIPRGQAEPAAQALERLAADPLLRDRLVTADLERAKERTIEGESARVAAFALGEGRHHERARARRRTW